MDDETCGRWQRQHGPFTSTQQFSSMLKGIEDEIHLEHPTLKLPSIVKTSLRIFLNQEMPQFALALRAAFEIMEPFGRCCVICFNRWEVTALRDFVSIGHRRIILFVTLCIHNIRSINNYIFEDMAHVSQCMTYIHPCRSGTMRNQAWKCRTRCHWSALLRYTLCWLVAPSRTPCAVP